MYTCGLLAALICLNLSFAFDLPRDLCSSELKISNNHYNVSDVYDVGDAYPTHAHYDVYGNLFYVESGRNEKGFYFNANVIKFKTTTPTKIPGTSFTSYIVIYISQIFLFLLYNK